MSKSQDSHNMKKRKLRNIFLFFFLILPLVLLFITYDPRLIAVASSSMEPSLATGDLAAVRKVAPREIRVGNIIAYNKLLPYSSVQVIVHRVVEVNAEGGFYVFKTKGDANPQMDPWDVSYSEVIGVVFGVIPKAGFLLYFVRTNLVGITLLSVGLGLILLYTHQTMELSKPEASAPIDRKPSHLLNSTPSISPSHQWSVSSHLPRLSNSIRRKSPTILLPAAKVDPRHKQPQTKMPTVPPKSQSTVSSSHQEVSPPHRPPASGHPSSRVRPTENHALPTPVALPVAGRKVAPREISVHNSETTLSSSSNSHMGRHKTIPLMMLVLENQPSAGSAKPSLNQKRRGRTPHPTQAAAPAPSAPSKRPRRQIKPATLVPALPSVQIRKKKKTMKPAKRAGRVKIRRATARPAYPPKPSLITTPSIEQKNETEESYKSTVGRRVKRNRKKTARNDKSARRLITIPQRLLTTKTDARSEKNPRYPLLQRPSKRLRISKRSRTHKVHTRLSQIEEK